MEPDQPSKGQAARPARRTQTAAVVALGLVAVAALVFLLADRPALPTDASADPAAAGKPGLRQWCDRVLGDPKAPVQVLAFLPVSAGCQDDIGLYLVDVAARLNTGLCVRIYDMKNDTARGLMQEHGVKCASVVVNGRTRFDLGTDLGKVLLEGPMDVADLRAVLQSELRSALKDTAPELPPVPVDGPGQGQPASPPASPPVTPVPGPRKGTP